MMTFKHKLNISPKIMILKSLQSKYKELEAISVIEISILKMLLYKSLNRDKILKKCFYIKII